MKKTLPMNHRVLYMLLGWALVAASLSAATLEDLQQSFMSRYDEANAERDNQSSKLERSYLSALEREMEKARTSGKLETVIPYRDEIAAIKSDKRPLPGLPDNATYGFKQMRKKYVDADEKIIRAHAVTLTELADKMDVALESKEEELTRSGKIEEALAVKRMRETLAEDAGIMTARERLSSNGGKMGKKLRGKVVEGDVALSKYGVTVLGMESGERMLDGMAEGYPNERGWASGVVPCKAEVDLKKVYAVGSIEMLLYDRDDRKYKYQIEASVDGKDWAMISDHSNRFVRTGWQKPAMEPMDLRYIRISGIENDRNPGFHVVELVVGCAE